MSDESFSLPPVPLMTPERARDIGRAYKALANDLAAAKVLGEARQAAQQSQWWLTYASTLASTKSTGEDQA